MTAALVLGAPGTYRLPGRVQAPYAGVRLDVTGFVGVAPRGPVGGAVAVEAWSEYQRLFGTFEGPGRLPYAVRAFFEQGGDRAYVVRVAPAAPAEDRPGPPPATALYDLKGIVAADAPPVVVAAANEGAWGSQLVITLGFVVALQFQLGVDGPDPAWTGGAELPLPAGVRVDVGALLRLRPAGRAESEFCWVTRITERDLGLPGRQRLAVLDRAPAAPAAPGPQRTTVNVIEGTLTVDDRDTRFARSERHAGLGLRPEHPRWISAVLATDSSLVAPIGEWRHEPVLPSTVLLPPVTASPREPGRDRYDAIEKTDFFDPAWDPLEDGAYRGVHGLLAVEEIGLVVVPDLAWDRPFPLEVPEPDPPPPRRAEFGSCPGPPVGRRPVLAPRPVDLVDARTREGLDDWIERQGRLVDLAENHQRFVVLLDVPPGLDTRTVSQWRAAFDSSYAAAYHPWLLSAWDDDERDEPVTVPPSAFAAGIIAQRERRLGLPWGPANELARGAVGVTDVISGAEHDLLHPLGVNVYLPTRDGMQLTAARTLSRQSAYRQLTVRRLLMMLRLTLQRDSQWMVFEPNNEQLWATIRFYLTTFLRQLYRGGALAGATEAEAFFVRCDGTLNPQESLDLGRLVVEVGVAPVEPLEFIVLRIERHGDNDAQVEERRA